MTREWHGARGVKCRGCGASSIVATDGEGRYSCAGCGEEWSDRPAARLLTPDFGGPVFSVVTPAQVKSSLVKQIMSAYGLSEAEIDSMLDVDSASMIGLTPIRACPHAQAFEFWSVKTGTRMHCNDCGATWSP